MAKGRRVAVSFAVLAALATMMGCGSSSSSSSTQAASSHSTRRLQHRKPPIPTELRDAPGKGAERSPRQ